MSMQTKQLMQLLENMKRGKFARSHHKKCSCYSHIPTPVGSNAMSALASNATHYKQVCYMKMSVLKKSCLRYTHFRFFLFNIGLALLALDILMKDIFQGSFIQKKSSSKTVSQYRQKHSKRND